MESQQVFLWSVLAIFNIATIRVLSISLMGANSKEALSEKSGAFEIKQIAGGDKSKDADQPTSYSRVAGALGAVVLSTFLWGVGNIVLYKAVLNPAEIGLILDSVNNYFIAGASLFAPYAVNQLRVAFGKVS